MHSSATRVRHAGAPLAPLLLLFFLSGASALIYQVLWMRLLALVFGVTVHAASTVLAAFMMGLALGSADRGTICRSRADGRSARSRSPKRWWPSPRCARRPSRRG